MATTGAGGDRSPPRDLGRPLGGHLRAVGDRVGPAHRVPGLGREGPAFPSDRHRTFAHGRGGAGVGRPHGRAREERLRRHERGADSAGAPAVRRGYGQGRVRRRDRQSARTAGDADRGRVGRCRLEPGGRGALPPCSWGCACSTAGCTSRMPAGARPRPGGSGNWASGISLDRVQGAMPFVVGKKAGCPDGTVGALRRRGARRRRPCVHDRGRCASGLDRRATTSRRR